MLSKLKNNFPLLLILLFGLLIRLYKLDLYPVSLNWDEISHPYNAYSLLKTGADQWGIAWPIFNFRAYGDYPTTLNMYLSLPLVKYFGLSSWTARLPSAILGFLTIIPIYFLAKLILKKRKLVLLATFLAAISPWSFFPSRAVFQSTVASFFFISGITFLLYALKKQKSKYFFWAMLFASLSQYAYHNTRLVVPLLIPIIILIFFSQFKKLFRKKKIIIISSVLLFLVFTIPQLLNLISPDSRARGRWTFILNDDAINLINNSRGQSNLSPVMARLMHNKFTYFVPKFVGNYLDFFNPKLLFFEGTGQYQFGIPHTGILFSVCLPLFYLGLIFLFKLQPKIKKLFIFWFAIGLLPATITSGDFPIIRAVTILPLPYILITLGFAQIEKMFSRKSILPLIFVFLLSLQFTFYWKNYFSSYATTYSQSWQYGYKQAIAIVKQNYSKYDQIIFTKKYGEPHEFVLFYWPWSPADYHPQWDYHASWFWVDAFDKFRFINDWEIKDLQPLPSTLLITSPDNYPSDGQLIDTVNFLDDSPAFDIISYED
jgi:4-amino-4-deoxy-L-arabinose transferase-like glycosyltransferase